VIDDNLVAFDKWWHIGADRGSICYKSALDAWRAATSISKCSSCRNWTPNLKSYTGKCAILKSVHGKIVDDREQEFGQFHTDADFGCQYWEQR